MFMLRMVGSNSGDFVCTQVLHNLWKLFLCKKCSQNGGTSTTTTTRPNSQEVASNSHHQTNSEFDEEDEIDDDDSRQKKKKPDSSESTSGAKSRFLFKKQQQQQKTSKMPQPQLKSMMINSRKKQSLIGRLFSDVVTSKSLSPVKSSSASNNGVGGKSRSIHLMQQQRQRMAKSSQHQPQARDERFSFEMKRFQSIKRITHSANRRNMNTLGSEQQQNDD